MNYIYLNLSVLCHSLFAMSLARFAFRNPNGITCGYAAFDLLLQNSSITKRCFVILSKAKNLLFLHISLLLRSLTLAPSGVDRWFAALQDDKYAIIVLCSLLSVLFRADTPVPPLRCLYSLFFLGHPQGMPLRHLHSVLCSLYSLERTRRYRSYGVVLCSLYSISRTSLRIQSQYARRSCATCPHRSIHPR